MQHGPSSRPRADVPPEHSLLIAVDSDGCVFDSMTIKQRIFHTGILRFWHLDAVEPQFRRIAEWVALFSPWRGLNRFELLLRIFDNLACYSEVPVPDTTALRHFVTSGAVLSADELARRVEQSRDPELTRVLEWSRAVSDDIAAVPQMPVFDEAPPTLRMLHEQSRMIVVSQTAEDALLRDWHQAELAPLADHIAGAESGSKADVLRAAMMQGFGPQQTMMIGDAPGDLEAAREAGCLFFPIRPGDENNSWIELRTDGLARLLHGTFAGAFQQEQIRRFEAVLQKTP